MTKYFYLFFAILITVGHIHGELAQTTRFWDCCKPSCAWNGKAPVSSPVLSCSIDGWAAEGLASEEQSGCDGGNAFSCNFHVPWAINDSLSYGYAAAHIRGQGEWNWCCACYELTFTSEPVAGKTMIVQIINTVGWPDENQFNLQIPGGGVGTYNGCKPQWGTNESGWGERYGGVKSENECNQLPKEIRSGCIWRFKWFLGAENPFAQFRQVICPEELLNKTQCQRDVTKQYFNGSTNQTSKFHARIQDKNRTINLLIYAVAIPLAILVIVVITTFLIYHYRTKHIIINKFEVHAFFKGEQETDVKASSDGENAATVLSYNKEMYEMSPSSFKVDMTECLGAGEFGKVCIGTVKRGDREEQVAVKMIKAVSRGGGSSHGNKVAIKGLLSEIKLLAYIGKHKHIAALIGAYTEKLRTGNILVFLELCKLGSLYKYLQNMSQYPVCSHDNSDLKGVSDWDNKLFTDLNRWAVEIADGMEFLAIKRLVHADLATRNVLLTSNKTAKIADFGLSRRLYDYTNYVKQQNQEPLPWRWMAPESLRKLVFNEKTDVWAFGITLWEMYTLGDLPYPGLNWEGNFPSRLEKGLRLDEPKYNLEGIYMIMLKCWENDPDRRPTFTKLKELLENRLNGLQQTNFKKDFLGESVDEFHSKAQENVYTVLDPS